MKKVILLVMASMFVFSAIVYAQTVPANNVRMNLKEEWGVKGGQKAVFFDHTSHVATLKCDSCHSSATPKAGDKVKVTGDIKGANINNAAHKFCWTCHDQQPKPNKTPGKTCTKCHTGK